MTPAASFSLVELVLIVLVPLTVIGIVAAGVYGFVYGAVKGRLGLVLASFLAPVALLFVGLTVIGVARYRSLELSQVPQADGVWVPTVEMPTVEMPPMPPVPPLPQIGLLGPAVEAPSPLSIDPDLFIWAGAIFLFVCGVLYFAMACGRRKANGEHRSGWLKTACIALLVVLALNFTLRIDWRRNLVDAAQARAEASRQKEAAIALRDAAMAEHARKVEQAQEQWAKRYETNMSEKAAQLETAQSLQQLYDTITRPRIELGAVSKDEITTVAATESAEGKTTQAVVVEDAKSPESLNDSLERLEKMVAQISAVADKVTDTGTLVGKAMVALNETIDSRRKGSPASISAVPDVQVAAVQKSLKDDLKIEANAVVELPSAPRPGWVDEAPKNVGNVRRQVLVAGEFATREECDREMDLQLFLATYNRIQELSNSGDGPLADTGPELAYKTLPGWVRPIRGSQFAAAQLGQLGIVGIDFIRREIAKQEYIETVDRSFGPMQKLYTQVEFTPSVDNELLQRWEQFRRSERFAQVGVGAGGVLGMIGLALGLMKVDTWTKGYYTKRLFLGVPAAIIGGLALLLGIAG